MATITTKTFTLEELERLPEDECGEVIRGEMLPVSPTGFDHGYLASVVLTLLNTWVRAHHVGFVVSEVGFVLRPDPLVVLAPDVAFVRSNRLPPPARRASFFDGRPDLAIEVVSPSQTSPELQDKVLLYLDAGTPLVWVVHPQQRTVTVYTPDRTARILGETDTLDGGEVLPGFTLALSEVFA